MYGWIYTSDKMYLTEDRKEPEKIEEMETAEVWVDQEDLKA